VGLEQPGRLIVEKQNVHLIVTMPERAKILASKRWQTEAFRGVIAAGRKTRTQVQKAVHNQMASRGYSLVSANTRGTLKRAAFAFEIWSPLRGRRNRGLQGSACSGAVRRRHSTDQPGQIGDGLRLRAIRRAESASHF
jgi:hypothetical protein